MGTKKGSGIGQGEGVMNAHRCEAETRKKKGPRPDRCTRRGVVFRGGKWYCCQHEPVAVSAPDPRAALAKAKG
jgi:hypothetical protein